MSINILGGGYFMKCPNCNYDNLDGDMFCQNCGAALNSYNSQTNAQQSDNVNNQQPQPQPQYNNANNQYQQPQYNNPNNQYQQPQYNQFQQNQPHPQNTLFMVLGILEALFCCLIGGIMAVVENNSANTAYKNNDMAGFEKHIKNVKIWLIVSPIVGIICGIISIIAQFAGNL